MVAESESRVRSIGPELPAWYPSWARQLAETYFAGTACFFVLHGNVHDLVACEKDGQTEFLSLTEFLGEYLFGRWDLVVEHNLSKGLQALAGRQPERHQEMMRELTGLFGPYRNWSRDPDNILLTLDQLIERFLIEDDPQRRKRLAVVFDFGQYMVPPGDPVQISGRIAARVVRFLDWARNPYIRRVNMAFCLISEGLSEINERLTSSPFVMSIEIPMPDRAARERFVQTRFRPAQTAASSGPSAASPAAAATTTAAAAQAAGNITVAAVTAAAAGTVAAGTAAAGTAATTATAAAGNAAAIDSPGTSPPPAAAAAPAKPTEALDEQLDAAQLISQSNGLSLLSLDHLLAETARSGGVTARQFRQLKKTAIERQCGGFLEFVEPKHTLDLVVGHQSAVQRLSDDARLISSGHAAAAPMGYLICGAVGTGKTFLAECYAGSIGIPCVKLKNFRSKYVGESEGNLQRVLTVLRSLGPVVVVIDEADAALGDRNQEGDSGTSGRIFSMIAQQMGDTRYRGQIMWMLLTCRPDLLPIDLKRQGRAEVHIPLFYPENSDEVRSMFRVLARKNGVTLDLQSLQLDDRHQQLSGADIESVVLTARRSAFLQGRTALTDDDIAAALKQFIPSAQGLEKDMQELAAVLECTQLDFLNAEWRETLEAPDGRAQLQQQLSKMRALVEQL